MKNFKSFKQFVKHKTSFVVEFARIEGHLVRTGRIERAAHGWQLLGADKSRDDVCLNRGSNRKELEKFAKHHKIKIALGKS